MRIVVVGGTGLVGARLVAVLRGRGHDAVAASRRTGVDAWTGAGLVPALAGAEVVVDATNAPDFTRAGEFFPASAVHIADAAAAAGVRRSVLLSVVGVDRVPGNPYFAAKVAQERAAVAGGVPTTVLRATQFFEFAEAVADQGTVDGRVRVGADVVQPVATDDVVDVLAGMATGTGGQSGTGGDAGRVDLAGPERMPTDVWVRRVLTAAGDPREVQVDPAADPFGTGGKPGLLVPSDPPDAVVPVRTATTTLATWLAARAR
jgi:uncharacterized protein YbjT (DUF2867 family)